MRRRGRRQIVGRGGADEPPDIAPVSLEADEPLMSSRSRLIVIGLILIALFLHRRDIRGALTAPITLTATEMSTLVDPSQLSTTNVSVVGAYDIGSPFHTVRSSYYGTPQPWNEHVTHHFRVLHVSKRLLLVCVPGQAPPQERYPAPRKRVASFTGHLRRLPADVERYLAKMESSEKSTELDPVYLPMLLDSTATSGTTLGALGLACVSLWFLALPVVAEYRSRRRQVAPAEPDESRRKKGSIALPRLPLEPIVPMDPAAETQGLVLNMGEARCPYCSEGLANQVVLCPACNVPHHRECWTQNGGRCTIFGCQNSAGGS
jgi:hypothetical protein